MAQLWEVYVRASPEVRGVIDQRIRDIANVLVFELDIRDLSAKEVMNRIYSTDVTRQDFNCSKYVNFSNEAANQELIFQ